MTQFRLLEVGKEHKKFYVIYDKYINDVEEILAEVVPKKYNDYVCFHESILDDVKSIVDFIEELARLYPHRMRFSSISRDGGEILPGVLRRELSEYFSQL